MCSAAMAVPAFYGGPEAGARLLASPEPGVLAAVAHLMIGSKYRTLCGASLLRLLDRTEPKVLREVMSALAVMYRDKDHAPERWKGRDGFEAGSKNAAMLAYWRAKRQSLLGGQ
jgi:hypothetical protein